MVEFADTEKLSLSNTVYINIANKENTLAQVYNAQNSERNNYYYNSDNLEKYLETLSQKMKRSDYKNILTKADKKIVFALTNNENKMKKVLKNIYSD
jgi:hypothetical protein